MEEMEESLINDKVGAWLLDKEHTRDGLADEMSMTAQTLANKLTGKSDWTWYEVRRLASIIGCSARDFVK